MQRNSHWTFWLISQWYFFTKKKNTWTLKKNPSFQSQGKVEDRSERSWGKTELVFVIFLIFKLLSAFFATPLLPLTKIKSLKDFGKFLFFWLFETCLVLPEVNTKENRAFCKWAQGTFPRTPLSPPFVDQCFQLPCLRLWINKIYVAFTCLGEENLLWSSITLTSSVSSSSVCPCAVRNQVLSSLLWY